jgi:hypothetical protein
MMGRKNPGRRISARDSDPANWVDRRTCSWNVDLTDRTIKEDGMSLPLRSPAARCGLIGLLAGVLISWAWFGGRVSARAQAATPANETSSTTVVTSPAPQGGQFLYVFETKAQAFAIYRVDPTNPKGSVKLEAVRQYRSDLKLSEYNNLPPEVSAIESMVGGSRR